MSETTNKMRDVAIYSDSVIRVRDLAADAIEAVEAQVAEAVARVAALEKRQGKVTDDRGPGSAASTVAPASPAAPSAVPAPRGFREGDIVRIKRTANGHEGWHGQEGPLVRDGIGLRPKLRFKGIGEPLVVAFHPHEYDLVRAAAAPEAPAEDAGLVERLARDWDKAESIWLDWATMSADGRTTRCNVVRHILSTLRAEGRLVEPGGIAALRVERDDLASQRDHWKARAEAAEDFLGMESDAHKATQAKLAETERECAEQMSGVATKLHDAGFNNVENLVGAYRFERAQADALRFSARTWFNEKGEPELLATAEEVTERRKAAAKELAALKSKPRFRTRKVTKADVEDFIAHDGCFYESLRALGFRRRVDGAK